MKKLGDISEYFNGLTYTPKDVSDNGVVVLRSSNIQNEKLDFSDIVRVNAKVKDKLFVNEGDILMCSRNGSKHLVGKTALILGIKEPMTFGTFMMIIRSEYNPYLLWYFKTDDFKRQISGGENTMINQVTRYMLNEIVLPFPPEKEQKRIVEILDSAFAKIEALRANARQNLQNAKDLFQVSLKQSLTPKRGWTEYLLKDVSVDFSRGKSKHRPRNDKKLFGGEYPFIQTGEIRNANKYVDTYSVAYNDFGLSQSKLWNAGTVCITIAANIAETAILSFASCFPDSVIGVFPDIKKTSSDFLYYLLQYSKLKLQELGKGSAQDNINSGTFENMLFSFPLLQEQQSIVEKLDALSEHCRAMEENYRQTLTACDELKKALLKKAFNGEL